MTIPRPVRLQLSRRKGFDLQAYSRGVNGLDAVNVARPGPWGNPFIVGQDGDRAYCVQLHQYMLAGMVTLSAVADVSTQRQSADYARANIASLTGKNLACWCRLDGKPCHADTLLQIANPTCEEVTP
jgi:Domain of unknown function (DUF4326)